MYHSNLANLLNGYTGIPTTENDPPNEEAPKLIFRGQTPSDTLADSRDILSFLVGKGYTSLNDDDAKGAYKSLAKTVGDQQAQKLVDQALLYNQRKEAQLQTPEQRVQSFYDIGSNDKNVSAYLGQLRNLGSGVIPGFRESVFMGNRKLTGREPDTATSTTETTMGAKLKGKIKNVIGQ